MENNGTATHIERIEIKGLWGRFDVDWKLNPYVNILVGKNGTGKTTILEAINRLYILTRLSRFGVSGNAFPVTVPGLLVEKIALWFNNKSLVSAQVTSNRTTKTFGNLDNPQLSEHVFYSFMGHFPIEVSVLKTFESQLLNRDEYEKENKPEIKTSLDKIIEDLIDTYVDYQLNQSQKALRKEQTLDQAFAKRTYFIETLNRLFADSGKKVDEGQNRIAFLLGDKLISAYQLSSGEKQLLILLLTVLTQDEKPSVLLLDEPESSLHLDWQYELINILRTLNPNCQLIIVTHSPSIFTDGHKPKVFWIEDIVHPTKQALELAK